MRNIFLIAALMLLSSNCLGQMADNTYSQNDGDFNTDQNVTRINLFNFEIDGNKIPVNLAYSHRGIRIGGLGTKNNALGWGIEDLGYIDRIVNGAPDAHPSKGWFNTAAPDFSSNSWSGIVCDGCQVPGNYTGADLSPDFFSCTTSNGVNFDFLFKKNPNNPVSPVLISNAEGIKINTNFSNFITDPSQTNSNVVFNIYDKNGTQYNFINGPNLRDYHYANDYDTNTRNNYYLQSIVNPNNTENISIEYYSRVHAVRNQYYLHGRSAVSSPGNYDYDNDIVKRENVQQDHFEIDDSHLALKKITSSEATVDFIYDQDNLLIEIEIRNSNGDYMSGYSFEYYNYGAPGLIWKINKFNKTKTDSEKIYEFEYFLDYPDLTDVYNNQYKQYEDYLGYYNGIDKTNPFPFAIREANNTITPAGNFTPDIVYAKQLSLKKIINKFSGTTEFDYQLNSEDVGTPNGESYGGGLILASKLTNPNIGKALLTSYQYRYLRGSVIHGGTFKYHYRTMDGGGKKFYSSNPELFAVDFQMDSFYEGLLEDVYYDSMHEKGNFFRSIGEIKSDNVTSDFVSGVWRNFSYQYEGFFWAPIIEDERYVDELGIIKNIIYNYSYDTIDTVDRATFERDIYRHNGNTHYHLSRQYTPIPVNRVKLSSMKEIVNEPNPFEKITNYSYIDAANTLLKNKTQTTSLGETIEERYSYPQETSMQSEPLVNNLVTKNIIGIPLKIETFNNNVKLSETKTVFAQDASTNNLLLPKYIYMQKGTDTEGILEKQKTYDSYDDKGNITQYTTENGVPVSIIWGYNKTKTVAVIENMAYASIPSGLITAIQTATDSPTGTEAQVLTALENLRNDAALSNAMVKGFAHKRLIGMGAVMEPNGNRTTYEYDDYNRLQIVKDKNGNKLSENQYNYKP